VGSTGINLGPLTQSTSVIPVAVTMDYGYNDPFSFPDRFLMPYHNYLSYTEFLPHSLMPLGESNGQFTMVKVCWRAEGTFASLDM